MTTAHFEAKLKVINAARLRGDTSENCGYQPAQWLRLGLKALEEGKELTPELLQELEDLGTVN